MTRGGTLLAGAALGVAAALAAAAAIGLAVVETGAYDVAASETHEPVVRWALTTNMENAVRREAEAVAAPEALTPEMVAAGAVAYQAMCAHCHAAPGAGRADWARGMSPQPPELAHAATEWSPREVFWIVRHGIRMTGMPSFGGHHDDAALWNLAAFVSELPAMTPETYRALTRADGAGGGDGD